MHGLASSIYDTTNECYYASINGKLVRGEAGVVAHDTHDKAWRHALAIQQQYGDQGYQRNHRLKRGPMITVTVRLADDICTPNIKHTVAKGVR